MVNSACWKTFVGLLCIGSLYCIAAQTDGSMDIQTIALLDGENFWGGCVTDGRAMPFGKVTFERDLYGTTQGNQAQPLLISDRGRYVWSEEPFKFTFTGKTLKIEWTGGEIQAGKQGNTLREVFQYVSRTYFPSNGQIPDELLFIKPQYNTWIELIYDQREDRIRKYASDILSNGFPAGVLMIDDNWQEDYGVWDFHPGRFSDPKDMMDTLHQQGFQVMLWICPYFSPDCETFRLLRGKGYFLKDKRGGTYIRKWWNGHSASLDLTNPEAVAWFQKKLDQLVTTYGVDGFKLDAGDAGAYHDSNIKATQNISPNAHSELWAKLGLPFKLNEYRACWKCAGLPLAQRLRDKGHNWQDLRQLIPDALALGLMGYAYICPDMIGGGEYTYFYNNPDKPLDQELIVRSTQCSALMPMMQFSVAPWRVLSKDNMAICRKMALLHEKMGPEILALAKDSSTSGEPMVRALEYMYPHQGYADIKNQFLLGDSILVAPVLEKGRRGRTVVFPKGTWQGDDGSTVTGPCTREIEVPLTRLPWYRRLSPSACVELSGELKKWHKVTMTLDGPYTHEEAQPNPFTDYRLEVVFTHDKVSYTVPGFYAVDGQAADTGAMHGNKWQVHFTPDQTGAWRYRVGFRCGSGIAVERSADAGEPVADLDGRTGQFTIANTDKTGTDLRDKGMVRYVNKHHLQFAETGDYFLKGGADIPENFLGYYEFDDTRDFGGVDDDALGEDGLHHYQDHAQDYSAADASGYTWKDGKGKNILGAVNYLAGKGMNSIYFLIYNIDGGDGSDTCVWCEDGTNKTRFDCSKLAQWERVFSYMDKKGIQMHVVLQEVENNHVLGDSNDLQRQLYHHEMAALDKTPTRRRQVCGC